MQERFKVLLKSGISQVEFARISGVSRLMVNRYAQGKVTPGIRTVAKVTAALNLLDSLVDRGKLPLPEGQERPRRVAAITKIKDYLDKST
jgi:transcriptional regulator with XRE-family HTH domain